MLEYVIVGLIVAAAALYAVRKYMPSGWRKQLSYGLGGSDAALGRLLNPDPGCGNGCDSCKVCADPEPPPAGARRIIEIRKS